MTWTIDPSHTQLGFSVRHMGLSTVRGRFARSTGEIRLDDTGRPTALTADIETASITTDSADRDAHLRSGDFFDAEAHPSVTFRSTTVTPKGGDRYEIHGDLTMRGVTRPIVLEGEISDAIQDPFGMQRRAATASGRINRKEWGLTWNQILEAGSLLVSEEVTLTIDAQLTPTVDERVPAAAR
jgi:polyisoprenoid-binding protein YceI